MLTPFSSRNESLSLIQNAQNMPTLPDRFLKIRDVISNSHSSSDDLSNIIETDFATSSTLLKIANSVAYNPHGNPLSSLPHTIARLGVTSSAEIAMSMSLLQMFTSSKSIHRVHALWAHSYAVAIISKYFYQRLKKPLKVHISTVFMMGLLHDIGQEILATHVDQNYFNRDFPATSCKTLCDAEQILYGIDHSEVGAIILESWGMPNILIKSTRNHHEASNDAACKLCELAKLFVSKHWPELRHIEEVHQLLRYSPTNKIDAILQTSPLLQGHFK